MPSIKKISLLIYFIRAGAFFISTCFALASFSQGQIYGGTGGGLGFDNTNVGRTVNLLDLNGQSLLRKYEPNITGSPFVNSNWIPAKITLTKGKVIGPIMVKLNIESNELYFLDSTGKEMVAQEGVIRKIEFLNSFSKDSSKYIFKNGYPNIDKQYSNFFYQVLTEGKIQLLVKKFKYVSTNKNAYTSEVTKEFVDGGNVKYLYNGTTIQELKMNKDFILSYMNDKMQSVSKFITENNINFKKMADIIQLITYYNELAK